MSVGQKHTLSEFRGLNEGMGHMCKAHGCQSFHYTHTMPSTASFSFMEWRHFFHWATEEWTYTLESEKHSQSSHFLNSGHWQKHFGQTEKPITLTIRSVPPATWWAGHYSSSEPPLSSGPAPQLWGLNLHHLSTDHSPWSSETTSHLLLWQLNVSFIGQVYIIIVIFCICIIFPNRPTQKPTVWLQGFMHCSDI